MRGLALIGLVLIAGSAALGSIGATGVRADDGGGHGDCHGNDCHPKTERTCFNLVCYYTSRDERDGDFHSCKATSRFFKDVTEDGGEVADDSGPGDNPTLVVSCDEKPPLYNNSAYRFTGLIGTRIQAETGPQPAISLPRGELHTAPNLIGGDHVSPSLLELQAGILGDKEVSLNGQCYIWTGAP